MITSAVALGALGDQFPGFPQGFSEEFFYLKGFLALVATLALIVHMTLTWHSVESWGRRLRYITLLYFAVLITASSVDQVHGNVLVDWRSLASIVGVVLLVATMGVSIREDKET